MEGYLWLIFVALGVLALKQLASIARSMQNTEAMIGRLLSERGFERETTAEPSERLKELAVGSGTRVEAIRAYRRQTGAGLKEAKAVVDRLSRHERSPA